MSTSTVLRPEQGQRVPANAANIIDRIRWSAFPNSNARVTITVADTKLVDCNTDILEQQQKLDNASSKVDAAPRWGEYDSRRELNVIRAILFRIINDSDSRPLFGSFQTTTVGGGEGSEEARVNLWRRLPISLP